MAVGEEIAKTEWRNNILREISRGQLVRFVVYMDSMGPQRDTSKGSEQYLLLALLL